MLHIWLALLVQAVPPAAATKGATPSIAAVELSFSTHAGEGAAGIKRFFRTGCYQVESEGGTGGGQARDSQAGCHPKRAVADLFARLKTYAVNGQLAPEAGDRKDDARRGRAAHPPRAQVTLVAEDGSRWAVGDETAAIDLERALNDLPSENQWYAAPPDPPVGVGAQLVVVSVTRSDRHGPRMLQASLTADGRWWCYRSVGARPGEDVKLPGKPSAPLTAAEAGARIGRILAAETASSSGDEVSVEAAYAGHGRAPVQPARKARAVADRFAAEMRDRSPACALP